MSSLKDNNGTACQLHGTLIAGPLPWFKFKCMVEDESEDAIFLIMGRAANEFFNSSASAFVKDKKYCPRSLPPEIRRMIGRTYLFQVRWGGPKTDSTRNDILVSRIIDLKTASASNAPLQPVFGNHPTALVDPSSKLLSLHTSYDSTATIDQFNTTYPATPRSESQAILCASSSSKMIPATKRALNFPLSPTLKQTVHSSIVEEQTKDDPILFSTTNTPDDGVEDDRSHSLTKCTRLSNDDA